MTRSYCQDHVEKIILKKVGHRLGRTCIHKVGQYYVKPGQIQAAMGTGEEKEDDVEEPWKGNEGVNRLDYEEVLQEESDLY